MRNNASKVFNDFLYIFSPTDAALAHTFVYNPAVDETHVNYVIENVYWPSPTGSLHAVHSGHLVKNINPNFC